MNPEQVAKALSLAYQVIAPLAQDLVPYLTGKGPLPEWFRSVPSPTRSRLALDARKARLAVKGGK